MNKKIVTAALCIFMLLPGRNIFAKEIETQSNTITSVVCSRDSQSHVLKEVVTRGASKPGRYASVHDLGISNYNYQIDEFGYRVYTDKWLTSDSGNISVNLINWTVLEGNAPANNKITFKLCDSSGVLVTSTKTISSSSANVTWINIDPDTKYYVLFEVSTNGNKYSANGSITD